MSKANLNNAVIVLCGTPAVVAAIHRSEMIERAYAIVVEHAAGNDDVVEILNGMYEVPVALTSNQIIELLDAYILEDDEAAPIRTKIKSVYDSPNLTTVETCLEYLASDKPGKSLTEVQRALLGHAMKDVQGAGVMDVEDNAFSLRLTGYPPMMGHSGEMICKRALSRFDMDTVEKYASSVLKTAERDDDGALVDIETILLAVHLKSNVQVAWKTTLTERVVSVGDYEQNETVIRTEITVQATDALPEAA